jgi:MFS family permease
LWFAQLVSQAGAQITVVAVFVQVYAITHSAAKVGIVGLVQFFPLMLTTIVGGPMIDRLDRRKILLGAQLGYVLTSASLFAIARMHHPSLALIYVTVAVYAGLSGISGPTMGSIIPNLISVELLPSAVALNQLLWNTAMIAGPALAGVIIAKLGLSWAYAIDLATYGAAIGAVALLPSQMPKRGDELAKTGWHAIKESFDFVRGRAVLRATFVVDLVAMIFGMPRALFPILAVTQFHKGPEVVGVLFSAIAAGAVIGALTAGWVGRVRRQGFAVLVAVAIWGAGIALFGVVHSLALALVLLAMAGTADVISAVFRGTILQATVTDAVRGRMSALHILVVTGGPRLGDLEAGLVASAFTPTVSVVSGGLACIAGVVVLAALMPSFAAYRAPAGAQP